MSNDSSPTVPDDFVQISTYRLIEETAIKPARMNVSFCFRRGTTMTQLQYWCERLDEMIRLENR